MDFYIFPKNHSDNHYWLVFTQLLVFQKDSYRFFILTCQWFVKNKSNGKIRCLYFVEVNLTNSGLQHLKELRGESYMNRTLYYQDDIGTIVLDHGLRHINTCWDFPPRLSFVHSLATFGTYSKECGWIYTVNFVVSDPVMLQDIFNEPSTLLSVLNYHKVLHSKYIVKMPFTPIILLYQFAWKWLIGSWESENVRSW